MIRFSFIFLFIVIIFSGCSKSHFDSVSLNERYLNTEYNGFIKVKVNFIIETLFRNEIIIHAYIVKTGEPIFILSKRNKEFKKLNNPEIIQLIEKGSEIEIEVVKSRNPNAVAVPHRTDNFFIDFDNNTHVDFFIDGKLAVDIYVSPDILDIYLVKR